MKKLAFTLIFLFAVLIVSAQKKQNVYFLKNDGQEVTLKDSADFIRVIEEPDSGEKYYNIKEFYKDGSKKLLGKVSSFEPKIYEGLIVSYHKNGNKKSSIIYEKDVSVGIGYYFYENGKVKKQLEFLERDTSEKNTSPVSLEQKYKLIYQVDSLDKVLVQDGNGHLIDTTKSDKDKLVEEGDYKDGFKDGVWKGHYTSGKSCYVESYASGKFISGVNTLGDKVIDYGILNVAPEFKGGIQEFYKYIGRGMKFPLDLLKGGINGTVFLSFTISEDGQINDAIVTKSLYPSADIEAVRVLKSSPKWIPGMQRGVPVEVKYNIPIKFSTR